MVKRLYATGLALTASVLLVGCSAAHDSSSETIPNRVERDAVLSAPYAASSLAAFAGSDFVTGVVIGEVVDTKTVVLDDAYVTTYVTILTDGSDGVAPHEVVTREYGGTVRLGQVRSDFEGHVPDSVLDANEDKLIEYVGDAETSSVGQQIMTFVGGKDTDPGGYFSAATMVKAKDGTYKWPGKAPNPSWEKQVGNTKAHKIGHNNRLR